MSNRRRRRLSWPSILADQSLDWLLTQGGIEISRLPGQVNMRTQQAYHELESWSTQALPPSTFHSTINDIPLWPADGLVQIPEALVGNSPGGHATIPKELPDEVNNMFLKPHGLCSRCRLFIQRSNLLAKVETTCRELQDPDLYRVERYLHSESLRDLETSRRDGCHFCTLLWQDILCRCVENMSMNQNGPIHILDLFTSLEWNTAVEVEVKVTSTRDYVLLKVGRVPVSGCYSALATICLRQTSSSRIDHSSQLSISTASNAAFKLARGWFGWCRMTHEKCTDPGNEQPKLPTRLVYVGKQLPLEPQLQLSTELTESKKPVEYLALSHCWGTAKFLTLRTSNIDEFRLGIPWERLSRTFQDAIITTARLGFSYIWIDSLCIIQDSREDWERESLAMTDVYRNAQCTIAAAGARDGNGGCFVTRNPLVYIPCKIYEGDGNCIVAEWSDLSCKSLTDAPLDSRGWVLQEKVLSRRTLNFGSQMLSWECAQSHATERNVYRDLDYARKRGWLKESFRNITTPGLPQSDFIGFYGSWMTILRQYTSCKLTFPKDRLVAISGVIESVRRATGLSNIAGLWREHLLPELMWFTWKTNARPSPPFAPSWSWASTDAAIHNGFLESLEALGVVWKMRVLMINEHFSQSNKVFRSEILESSLIARAPFRTINSCDWKGRSGDVNEITGHRYTFNWDSDELPNGVIWFATIARAKIHDNHRIYGEGIRWKDAGLVLVPTSESGPGIWRRVGYLEVEYRCEEMLQEEEKVIVIK